MENKIEQSPIFILLTICLLYGYNFKLMGKVQDRSECWFDVLLLNTEDQVQ